MPWKDSLISGVVFWVLFIFLALMLSHIIPARTAGWVPDFTSFYYAFSLAVIGTILFIFKYTSRKILTILITMGTVVLLLVIFLTLLYLRNILNP